MSICIVHFEHKVNLRAQKGRACSCTPDNIDPECVELKKIEEKRREKQATSPAKSKRRIGYVYELLPAAGTQLSKSDDAMPTSASSAGAESASAITSSAAAAGASSSRRMLADELLDDAYYGYQRASKQAKDLERGCEVSKVPELRSMRAVSNASGTSAEVSFLKLLFRIVFAAQYISMHINKSLNGSMH